MMALFLFLQRKNLNLDSVIVLEHGKPLMFGANKDKGIMLDGFESCHHRF
jgi:hypothetical protein